MDINDIPTKVLEEELERRKYDELNKLSTLRTKQCEALSEFFKTHPDLFHLTYDLKQTCVTKQCNPTDYEFYIGCMYAPLKW
jgi:hypothetical protein